MRTGVTRQRFGVALAFLVLGGVGACGEEPPGGGTGGVGGVGGVGGEAGAGGDPCAGLSCDDDNPCTDDACDPSDGCRFVPNQLPCDDSNACTSGDQCVNGVCLGTATVCVDDNPCTLDTCDPSLGCRFSPTSEACNDGNECTRDDQCSAGACQGTPISCDDDNPCTDDACEPSKGCSFVFNELPCDDGSACTEGDQCFAGLCSGSAITCADENPCTSDSCVAATGCLFSPTSGPCDDGNLCTVGDSCIAGVCTPGTPRSCDDQSSCTADACNPLSGCTHEYLCDGHASCVAAACECESGYEGDGYSCAPQAPVCSDGQCTGSETVDTCPADCNHDLVVVVEAALAGVLEQSFQVYLADLAREGYLARVEPWTPGTVQELKTFLFQQVDDYGVEGALLIGNLPAAWYEQVAFGKHEEFPLDLFLEDRDATWTDADEDGIYDAHSELELDIFVSRLQTLPHAEECVSSPDFPTCPAVYDPGGAFYASAECIQHCPSGFISQRWVPSTHPDVECCGTFFLKRYFERAHVYRTQGSLVNQEALVFVDDDWWSFGEPFGLDGIYSTVHVLMDIAETTKPKYLEMLSGGGVEYVYHWIHGTPNNLFIYVDEVAQLINRTQIGWNPFVSPSLAYDFESSFMNMFSCEAARFTVPSVGMAVPFQTDYGLAVIGSTKLGGIWKPDEFHAGLLLGESWGQSFRRWYNTQGKNDDEWHLGMVLLGDPMLTLTGDVGGPMWMAPARDLSPEQIEALRQTMMDVGPSSDLDTFEDYKESNPQFFDD